jgi:exosortase
MSTVTVATAIADRQKPLTAVKSVTQTVLRNGWPVLIAVILLYGRILVDLAREWTQNDNYSHGLIVPFAIAYLLYQKRGRLFSIPIRPSALWGLATIVGSQSVLIVGFLGAEFFLQRFSFVLLLAGLVLFLFGTRMFSEVFFGFLLLAISVPLPAIAFDSLALPLQLLASSWAETFLRLCGVPVFREGNVLQLSFHTLNVSEACSGIRSLNSLLALALMLGYFIPMRRWVRVIFVLSAIPIALVMNAARVAGTGLLGLWFGERAAEGFFHTFSGWAIFIVAFVLLCGEMSIFQRFFRPRPEATA